MPETEKIHKYQMSMSLNVLNHLGFNLYSNIPAVLSEVVANAYDADATDVNITIGTSSIIITDNGHGMTLDDINNKFLFVGYQRRENNEALSFLYKRPVMGRKGIGKLSLFSIANTIEIHTTRLNEKTSITEKNGFILSKKDIIDQIQNSKNNIYHPKEKDKTLPTFGDHFMLCLMLGIAENVNLKKMYPKTYFKLSRWLEEHNRRIGKAHTQNKN